MPYNSIMKFFKRQLLILLFSLLMAGLFAAPAAPAAGASAPAAGNPPPAPGPGPGNGAPPPRPPRPLPPSPKNPDNMLYYRGSRTTQEEQPLIVNQIKAERIGPATVDIEIAFNQSINPRTIKPHFITVDGLEIPKAVRFWFNKKGDTVKFTLPSEKESFKIEIKCIRAFDGTLMNPAVISVEVAKAAEGDSVDSAEEE